MIDKVTAIWFCVGHSHISVENYDAAYKQGKAMHSIEIFDKDDKSFQDSLAHYYTFKNGSTSNIQVEGLKKQHFESAIERPYYMTNREPIFMVGCPNGTYRLPGNIVAKVTDSISII